ncbi:MAG: metallophosphoesterase [Myxococcota bacterium]|jgi:3',5'-cyclic AMP phosphodiesterase CpdA|nr:metallophosphoesterase [Myxococcota bacterium]
MTALLQISDPHFGTEVAAVVEALVELARRVQPGLVVLSGDITQRARRSQFARARAFADRLCAPLLAIPGNHDIPLFNPLARAFFPYQNYAQAFGAELEPSFETADLLVLGVKTTRRHRHKHGEVSAAQIERVASRLQSARSGQLRVVVTHQPVLAIRAHDETNLLRGSERAVPRWCEAGADLFLGGHIHLPYLRPLSQRFGELPRRAWVAQAGTSVSHRTREGIPNSVNLLQRAEGEDWSVERWDFHATRRTFERVEVLPITPER